jgi:hypothetical protein
MLRKCPSDDPFEKGIVEKEAVERDVEKDRAKKDDVKEHFFENPRR